MAQQMGPATKAATAPHQYALLTRSGCEYVAHVLQGNPRTTVTSIDGVSACICVKMQREKCIPSHRARAVSRDPMIPLLFAVGQHQALDTVSRSLREDEKLLAYLDDIYFCL